MPFGVVTTMFFGVMLLPPPHFPPSQSQSLSLNAGEIPLLSAEYHSFKFAFAALMASAYPT